MTAPRWRGAGQLDEGRGAREVGVELTGGHLGVFEMGQPPRWWATQKVRRMAEGAYDLGGGVVLRVEDAGLWPLLAEVPPEVAERLWPTAAVMLLSLGLVVWAAWHFALPGLADGAARLIPAESERRMGMAIADAFAPPATLARDADAQQALQRIVGQLSHGFEDEPPYEYVARLHCAAEINAAAAPGGIIIVLDGLVQRVETPGQLAAVLAHEMQHGAQRHMTRALFRRFALQLSFGLLTGDITGVAALAAAGLAEMGYSREDEFEADREGARLMARAGLDAREMASLLSVFGEEERRQAQGPSYLRTHPGAAERRAQIELLLGGLRRGSRVEMERRDWEAVRQGCRDQQQVRGETL